MNIGITFLKKKFQQIKSTDIYFLFFLFFSISFLIDFIYLFLERGGEGKREGETGMCCCLLNAPYLGPGP